jgi:lysozyme family protein
MLYTLQALSEDDRKSWMDVMDGKEPVSRDGHSMWYVVSLIHCLQAATSFGSFIHSFIYFKIQQIQVQVV